MSSFKDLKQFCRELILLDFPENINVLVMFISWHKSDFRKLYSHKTDLNKVGQGEVFTRERERQRYKDSDTGGWGNTMLGGIWGSLKYYNGINVTFIILNGIKSDQQNIHHRCLIWQAESPFLCKSNIHISYIECS